MLKKSYIVIISLSILLLLSGCDQQGRVRGVRERNKLQNEPDITVKLPDGQERNMKFEEYVTGVVAGEMKKDWPENAYAAQAILARTFALKYMDENNTSTISGSYQFAQEFKPQNVTEDIKTAVEKTRGEVLVYKDDYIKGWFHSSAAGQTTSAKVGLAYEKEEPPYVKSVKSPDELAPADIQNWTARFTPSDIEQALSRMGKEVGNLQNIEIVDKDKTGRVITFKITGASKSVSVKAANFRKEVGPKKLKSTKISKLEKSDSDNMYVFTGSGFGHGVGMSQWGAYSMARDGKTPEEIVSYYFNDIEIVKEYD